jgi:hypothetical protein
MFCFICGKKLTRKQEINKNKYCSPFCYYKSQVGRLIAKEIGDKIGSALRGRPKSDLHSKKISESLRGKMSKEKNPMFEKQHSELAKEKMRLSKMGSIPWNKGIIFEKKKITKICKNCGKAFDARSKSRVYCSRLCCAKQKANKKLSEEHKNKIGLSNIGRVFSEETCRKIRINTINRIKNNYGNPFPSYNKKACEYFKRFDEENNTKGQYALYGGGEYYIKDLGYWLDYINFEKKLIIEFDEGHHYLTDGSLREKDIVRQKEIENLLNDFIFIRIKENSFEEVSKCQ